MKSTVDTTGGVRPREADLIKVGNEKKKEEEKKMVGHNNTTISFFFFIFLFGCAGSWLRQVASSFLRVGSSVAS